MKNDFRKKVYAFALIGAITISNLVGCAKGEIVSLVGVQTLNVIEFPAQENVFLGASFIKVGKNIYMDFTVLNESETSICLPSFYTKYDSRNYDFLIAFDKNDTLEPPVGKINYFISSLWDTYSIVPPNWELSFESHPVLKFKKSNAPYKLNFRIVLFPCKVFETNDRPSFKDIVDEPKETLIEKYDALVFERQIEIE